MNKQRTHSLASALASAAIAGLTLGSAYAAPNYIPATNSPINTLSITSDSAVVNSFEGYIDNIATKLATLNPALTLSNPPEPGKTLATSSGPNLVVFYNAVSAAVGDATTAAEAEAIVQAASAYFPGKVKDIVRVVSQNHPSYAEAAVAGATKAVPTRAPDAAAGAVTGLIASAQAGTADYADVTDDAAIFGPISLIEKTAKAAVAGVKKTPVGAPPNVPPDRAEAVGKAMVDAAIAAGDPLFIDDVARGAYSGANGIIANRSPYAAALLDRLDGTPMDTELNAAAMAFAILNLAVYDSNASNVGTFLHVKNGILAGTVGASYNAGIEAGAAIMAVFKQNPSSLGGGGDVAFFTTTLTPAYSANIGSYIAGAAAFRRGSAGAFVEAALEKFADGHYTVAQKKEAITAAVRANVNGAPKTLTLAVGAATNAVANLDAVDAAIKAGNDQIAGKIAGAAVKLAPAANTGATASNEAADVASAALDAAVAAGLSRAIPDIALASVKSQKLRDTEIVSALISNANSAGWHEAVISHAVASNKNNATNLQTAALAATGLPVTDPGYESVRLAAGLALLRKNNPKSVFDDSIEAFYGQSYGNLNPNSDYSKAIYFSALATNAKLSIPMMALSLKLDTGAATPSDLRNIAISTDKKNQALIETAYSLVTDILPAANTDSLFDVVDHYAYLNPKAAPDLASAAAVARPEFAHYVARAASFRAPAAAGKVGANAITFGHMKSNRDATGTPIADPNDPAAVAAISAATILGVKDAKLVASKETAAIRAAAGGLVKAAFNLEDDDTIFLQSDGSGGAALAKAKGSAGAVTGIVAMLQDYVASGTPVAVNSLNSLTAVAITAAAKAGKAHGKEIAQAAAQAAQWVFTLNGGIGTISFAPAIVSALVAGGISNTVATNAVNFGISQALASIPGAGADGLLNYAHRSGVGTPVTDISNF